ncbi:MAG TPA: M67 family metallopeptidase [Candidatus Sulfotelmatobacter sp.]|nr:M67 family metallopeptidase [Candidatus Sulfotelmatobacter sp.]
MADKVKIWLDAECAEKIRAHGVETYPHESCGALIGRDGAKGKPREILEVLPLVNRRDDSPRNRFSVSTRDVIAAEREAQARGLSVVGWYHSHPDHSAKPSEFDREHAWPWYSYIIVSVEKGVAREMRSWQLREDRAEYLEEEVEEVKDAREKSEIV